MPDGGAVYPAGHRPGLVQHAAGEPADGAGQHADGCVWEDGDDSDDADSGCTFVRFPASYSLSNQQSTVNQTLIKH